MQDQGRLMPLLEEILKALNSPHESAFYNKPIFLTLVSITFGGILLTIITKHFEQRIKKRDMSIAFLDEVGNSLNNVLASIAGHRKRRIFGSNIKPELDDKRGELFRKLFSVKVKSKAFLGSDAFCDKYEYIIHEIDLAIYLMKKLSDCENPDLQAKITARIQNLDKEWPSTAELNLVDILDCDVHKEFYKLEKMLWVRANSLVSDSLSNIM